MSTNKPCGMKQPTVDRDKLDEALEHLKDLARQPRPSPPRYLLHLCHDGAKDSLCGMWIGSFNGQLNENNQNEVVATAETLEYWRRQQYNFQFCYDCEAHEDFNLVMLGAV